MGAEGPPENAFTKAVDTALGTLEAPAKWFRENIIDKNRPSYPWYHYQFRRVPTIDECYTDDVVCYIEANEQFKRDRMVDNEVLNILRKRMEDCTFYEAPNHREKCAPMLEAYEKAAENWFIKYGDLGAYGDVKDAYMKQKHRMVWERRHGPVGSGMKGDNVH
ncbi:NADH dehydrogenase [ubiquinone] 1 beta subcomplex subunit 10 [Macrobrachium rosenbergii]|uniref:NADH dehydrogenase [ubiquinone] 1 beta subcomplex subunit 10 n=1 Tax=Macrobrachium rosenbergii TaxID=79674 RepID=UPI0034D6837A